jgi:hypothetical protein
VEAMLPHLELYQLCSITIEQIIWGEKNALQSTLHLHIASIHGRFSNITTGFQQKSHQASLTVQNTDDMSVRSNN